MLRGGFGKVCAGRGICAGGGGFGRSGGLQPTNN